MHVKLFYTATLIPLFPVQSSLGADILVYWIGKSVIFFFPIIKIGIYRKKKLKKKDDGRTHGAPFRGYGYVPLRFGGNVVRRMGTHTHTKKG